MANDLLIMRHAKASRKKPVKDFERPLTRSSKLACFRVGTWIVQQVLIPDYILCSPAVRALETARKTCKAMGLNTEMIHEEPALYHESAETLLSLLRDIPGTAKRVLLVGHNPELDDLLQILTGTVSADTDDGVQLSRGGLAHLRLTQSWQDLEPGSAALQTIVRPKKLPDKFPYSEENRVIEQRDRPAYYYTQSGVVPYRIADGQIEVLVISSSGGRHWVMPKGIAEPGISLQDSALQEANEEAGVDGIVEQEPLGEFQYDKWGSQCTVTVYPMLVLREIPEQQREEKHRQRRWMSPAEAVEILDQPALAGMVELLVKQLKETA